MYWLEVSVVTDGEAAEAVAEALRPLSHNEGVVIEQKGAEYDLDPYALEPDVVVKIYLPQAEDTPQARQRIREILYHLNRLYPIPEPTFRKLEDKDWATAWKEHYRPFRVGRRLWIEPSWLEPDPARRAEDVVLTLDPGRAFGTGLHPTTQMCLQVVETLARPGMRVLDVGTGSGILAIAAAKLGAGRVLAVDTDSVAARTARENAAANGVGEQITVREGGLDVVAETEWDLVLVNILAPVIVALLEEGGLMAYVAPSGRGVLSGIIEQQVDDVMAALTPAGGHIVESLTVRDWVTYVVQHKGQLPTIEKP